MIDTTRSTEAAGTPDAARIAAQNDIFRRGVCRGVPCPAGTVFPAGKLVITAAVLARGDAFLAACLSAIGTLEDFPPENDPDGHHDFGAVDVQGRTVWFKIDLYDPAYEYGSEVPDDLAATARVLTVLFPEDW